MSASKTYTEATERQGTNAKTLGGFTDNHNVDSKGVENGGATHHDGQANREHAVVVGSAMRAVKSAFMVFIFGVKDTHCTRSAATFATS